MYLILNSDSIHKICKMLHKYVQNWKMLKGIKSSINIIDPIVTLSIEVALGIEFFFAFARSFLQRFQDLSISSSLRMERKGCGLMFFHWIDR